MTGANTCPFCHRTPCLPLWRKLTLGPAASAHCRTCFLKVSADAGRAWLALAPTILLVILTAAHIITAPVTLLILLVVCLTLTFGLYITWVGLVPNQVTSAAMLEQARARAADHPK